MNLNNDQNSQQDSKKTIRVEGRVIEALPNAFFKVVLSDKREVMGFLSGKMRMNRITILPGDRVTLEMTPYDESKGRIVYRLK
ncbi:MAG: translation initiation factor IF-1 [Candidatus Staskawiczbacteria bacterium RIFCSPLOWO2_12_FULL_37_15]|uniref:Translation initiation factor IF-1 n=1 Tax=Candidatus Staskawiczbacteria bacterium RIFCSPLOWO2_12_FULL_37_15 TaxID=1802218 RepID=A0A1G2IRJ5_9BACT|nr:MAG: Translation initiation factor IF-1 [Parcubacteria group bacterium GW2011_GWA2_37_10]OGZ77436.1 MAG: translation initiation factor IF-1 [Candidatus Staskawiczbacteria bacterium RIFCSPLOWO2_12_FULL_37_15]